jgi:hypothetical protein
MAGRTGVESCGGAPSTRLMRWTSPNHCPAVLYGNQRFVRFASMRAHARPGVFAGLKAPSRRRFHKRAEADQSVTCLGVVIVQKDFDLEKVQRQNRV